MSLVNEVDNKDKEDGADINLNLVFSGNFLYPHGMAGTKRVQYFIDSVKSQSDVNVRVLLFRQGHAGRDAENLNGIHHGVPYATIGEDLGVNIWLPVAFIRYLINGFQLLKSWRLPSPAKNILFIYGEPNAENGLFILYAKLIGYQIIFDIVEDSYRVDAQAALFSRFKAWSSRQASARIDRFGDAVIVISRHLQQKFISHSNDKFPVQLIPISVDLSRVSISVRSFNAPVRIFYAGSFAEKDGVEGLIDAFEIVASQTPGVELMLVGKGMASRIESVMRKIKSSRFEDKIRYLGYLPDDEYYVCLSEADLLCVVRDASDYADRGFPFKLGEYLAAGRPVIAANVGDISSFITDGESGFLVEPGDSEKLAQKIQYVLSHQQHAIEVGSAGRTVAEKYFDAEKNSRAFVRLVRSLC